MVNNATLHHTHIYDPQGQRICCTETEKIYRDAGAQDVLYGTEVTHSHEHSHDHADVTMKMWRLPFISFIILAAGLLLDHFVRPQWFNGWWRIGWYVLAYLPVGLPVIREMFGAIAHKDLFSEFTLMVIATTGAFAIGQYPEAVAVMLFYAVGETLQTLAVRKAKGNIQSLLDNRPDTVTIIENDYTQTIAAKDAGTGQTIQLKAGERLALDGKLLSDTASFNTASLTGESKPDMKYKGDTVLAGMINQNTVADILVTTPYEDSKLSRILDLVQHATKQKARTELFIRRFANIYTPIVILLALALCLLPYFFVTDYVFREWLYRALIFLVISCPCALVVSIPLGYFGGIGAASRNGILVKGSNFLDLLAGIKHVVMDKTGTLTKGVFRVQEIHILPGFDKELLLQAINVVESKSTHPAAVAIHKYLGTINNDIALTALEEVPGHGMKAIANGVELLLGNDKLLKRSNVVDMPASNNDKGITLIYIACNNQYAGYISIADEIKEDASDTINGLHALGISTTMLSGDKDEVVQQVARQLKIQDAYGGLLPEDKADKIKAIKAAGISVAFAGDGVNDAPVIALSDVGIAMGGLGSDAAIATADVVVQDDKPSKIPLAIRIGKATKRVVIQNIVLAFAVKAIVLLLGASGHATMWEAVFADVGVALLAILNAVRIQQMHFYTR